jgi:hypothetical protein
MNDAPMDARAKVPPRHAAKRAQMHTVVTPVVEDSAFDRLKGETSTAERGGDDANGRCSESAPR